MRAGNAGNRGRFWLIAGPNGVGKTRYALAHLAAVTGSLAFVNLDEIARGLSPLDPAAARQDAARVALERVRALLRAGETFAMETTLAGRTHLRLVREAGRRGSEVGLLYFTVPDPEICLRRIARRVAEGGHDVPEADVRRRFARSLANLPLYAAEAAPWRVLDATGPQPVVIAEGHHAAVAFRDDERLKAAAAPLRAALGAMARGGEA
jgi:predicted ABC-type ATPase